MKIPAISCAAALLGLLLPEASAAIVHTKGFGYRAELGWPGRGEYVQDIDMDGDGAYDFYFEGGGIDFWFVPVGDNRILSTKAPLPDLQRNTVALTKGAVIGAEPTTGYWTGNADAVNRFDLGPIVFSIVGAHVRSTIPQNEVRYLGLEYHLEDGIHYGWLAISSSLVFTASANIIGWAYETEPGKPIIAGAIPEPSVALLLVAGASLLGYAGRRKH